MDERSNWLYKRPLLKRSNILGENWNIPIIIIKHIVRNIDMEKIMTTNIRISFYKILRLHVNKTTKNKEIQV